jgi:ABC-type phosphonate transport system ATPase subunit
MEGGWVYVDPSEALGMLNEVEQIVSCNEITIMRYGAQLLREETERAFREQVDPDTGRAWPQRKHDYPWPLLNRTGTLRSVLRSGWGVRTEDGRPKLFGKVEDGSAYGEGVKNIVVAGAVHFGRTKHRTRRGTKKPRIAPTTGITPPRPLFGFGRSAQQKFAARFEQLITKADR